MRIGRADQLVATSIVRPLAATAVVQVIAFATLSAIPHMISPAPTVVLLGAALAVSGLASIAAFKMGIGSWIWVGLNGAAPFCGLAIVALRLPSTPFFLATLFVLTVFAPAIFYRVPLYTSSRPVARAIRRLAAARRPSLLVDLGSGVGTILLETGTLKSTRTLGIEAALVPYLISVVRLRWARNLNCEVRFGNLFSLDLSKADLVYAFLSPAPMARLIAKARREMPRGALLVSNSFSAYKEPPDRVIKLRDARGSRLLIWIMRGGDQIRACASST